MINEIIGIKRSITFPLQLSTVSSSAFAYGLSGFVEGEDGFSIFIRAIPYNFYAILTIVMMIAMVMMKVEYGPMKLHEDNAKKGDIYTTPELLSHRSDTQALLWKHSAHPLPDASRFRLSDS